VKKRARSGKTARIEARHRITAVHVRRFRGDLLDWFAVHRRSLPWRINRTPYRVWVSELMLQQTRVDQATPYFLRFVKKFPSVRSLAAASRADVLKAWEGLGYYRRAAHAHETAKQIVAQHDGLFPDTYAGLLALKGIGPYTAAAVASLAYGLDHAVLDGNVIRVMTRVLAVSDVSDQPSVRKKLQATLDHLLPPGRAAAFNEAMMEVGALVCLPASPRCDQCPLAPICQARKQGRPTDYPVRKARNKIPHRHVGAGIIINDQGLILIARRKDEAMLGGLWEFPGGGVEHGESIEECIRRELKEELGIDTRAGPHLVTVHHAFSHFTMDLHAHWVRIVRGSPRAIGCSEIAWAKPGRIGDYALPRADQKIRQAILKTKDWPAF